jgi:predicted RNA-binding Zn ribbon-like protein
MPRIRRSVIKIGGDLGIDFANAGELRTWADLVNFLELRKALSHADGARLRAMAERDAHGCAAALSRGLRLQGTIRATLAALAAKRRLQAGWIAEINEALSWGVGTDRLVRDGTGWRIGFTPLQNDPLRVLAPVARSIADLAAMGRAAEIRKCANPRCVLYFRDRSRAKRRRWCSMAVCGNRMKVAAYARRQRRRRRT